MSMLTTHYSKKFSVCSIAATQQLAMSIISLMLWLYTWLGNLLSILWWLSKWPHFMCSNDGKQVFELKVETISGILQLFKDFLFTYEMGVFWHHRFTVPCGRLSWLLVRFWAHVNIVVGGGINDQSTNRMPNAACSQGKKCSVLIQLGLELWLGLAVCIRYLIWLCTRLVCV